jgi:prepilin-type N-terminal cleavage/methylation domain-containing protein
MNAFLLWLTFFSSGILVIGLLWGLARFVRRDAPPILPDAPLGPRLHPQVPVAPLAEYIWMLLLLALVGWPICRAFDFSGEVMGQYAAAAGMYLIHIWLLGRLRSLNTHHARHVLLFFLLTICLLTIPATFHETSSTGDGVLRSIMLVLLIVGVSMFTSLPLIVYSIPCTPFSSLPLLLIYFSALFFTISKVPTIILFLPFIATATLMFPMHRRLRELWRPAPLPRLPRVPLRGVTLIELLIVIAIVAILSAGVSNLSGTTRLAISRAEERRQALDLARDQLALLRAAPSLPSLGTHPLDPSFIASLPAAAGSDFVIAPGPTAQLQTVHVRLRLTGTGQDWATTISTLIAVPAGTATLAESGSTTTAEARGTRP